MWLFMGVRFRGECLVLRKSRFGMTCGLIDLDRYDGQLGTAAITLSSSSTSASTNTAAESAFLTALIPHLKSRGLPEYAFPRLIRFTEK